MSSMKTGPQYWRSLDELAETPEFKEWVAHEFPAGASEMADPVSRRRFVKLMSASFLLAGLGLTGCRRPEERIYPAVKQDSAVPGVAQYFATAMPNRKSAIPLLVKSYEGRPVKNEGNKKVPGFNGGTDVYAQASILGLYDPDRASRFAANGITKTREEAFAHLDRLSKSLGTGKGTAFLLEQSSSPSLERVQHLVAEKLPEAHWFEHEPIDLEGTQAEALYQATGLRLKTHYRLEKARVLVAFDCDFLGAEANSTQNIASFAKTRNPDAKSGEMSRLYAVESLLTVTGSNADHRLRVPPSLIVPVLAALANEVVDWGALMPNVPNVLAGLTEQAKEHRSWVHSCARDLRMNVGNSAILVGHRAPLAAHLIALLINQTIRAHEHILECYPENSVAPQHESLEELARSLNAGTVDTLVILGPNPSYTAPIDLNWAQSLSRAKNVIRLGLYEDESSRQGQNRQSHWDFPKSHFLESWGDLRTQDGTLLAVQPLIEPLFGGITELELLARIGGLQETSPHAIVQTTFRQIAGTEEKSWTQFLSEGFWPGTETEPVAVKVDPGKVFGALIRQRLDHLGFLSLVGGNVTDAEVVFYRDSCVDDGRYSNNGWLQELPDPISKLTWDNAILVSPATAKVLGVTQGMLQIALNEQIIRGPLLIQPGMADSTVGLALGYGRSKSGRIDRNVGFNAYALRTTKTLHYAENATVRLAPGNSTLATTQAHWSMEGREIVREVTLEQYRRNPGFAQGNETPNVSLYPNPLDQVKAKGEHQWGMAIDLNKCVGCSACVIACQSENNIPIVGKAMVAKSREMHWLRVDRYYTGSPENPHALSQPMFCQHCESAPCENVCPVNATVHDEQGLNLMVYNRCVGTRYCSNNCPFKVRRFNFFDYNRRALDELYKSPITSKTDGEWDLKRWLKDPDRGYKPGDEWQMAEFSRNPDVSVRMRGVMEKCTFCVQRIEQARITQKIKAGASDKIRLSEAEGTVPMTACQQACPAEAIVFGDLSDPSSRVSRIKANQRNYTLFEHLNLKTRLSYLGKVRNINSEMA